VSDAQVGHEKTLTGLLPALAGANLVYGLGMIESGMTFDYGQLVMDNEFARMIKYVVAGILVTDETLGVDATVEIGPFGDFLMHESTQKYMKSQSQAKLLDRKMRDRWESAGSTTLYQRALEEARRILKTHQPAPLPAEVLAELRSIVESSEEELGVSGRA
jgi:trimethylamine--corrinoid protein Co-methyltransferase